MEATGSEPWGGGNKAAFGCVAGKRETQRWQLTDNSNGERLNLLEKHVKKRAEQTSQQRKSSLWYLERWTAWKLPLDKNRSRYGKRRKMKGSLKSYVFAKLQKSSVTFVSVKWWTFCFVDSRWSAWIHLSLHQFFARTLICAPPPGLRSHLILNKPQTFNQLRPESIRQVSGSD